MNLIHSFGYRNQTTVWGFLNSGNVDQSLWRSDTMTCILGRQTGALQKVRIVR